MTPNDRDRIVKCAAGISYDRLPIWACDELQRYFEHGVEPDSALRAALENNLKEWVARAYDGEDYEAFGDHTVDVVRWLCSELPSVAWGSPEKVEAWLSSCSP